MYSQIPPDSGRLHWQDAWMVLVDLHLMAGIPCLLGFRSALRQLRLLAWGCIHAMHGSHALFLTLRVPLFFVHLLLSFVAAGAPLLLVIPSDSLSHFLSAASWPRAVDELVPDLEIFQCRKLQHQQQQQPPRLIWFRNCQPD
jgi:hypothetical protein